MDYIKWYEQHIGCNGEIDWMDTVKDKIYIMNIEDNYCIIKCCSISFKILFNITTEQRLNRRAVFKEEYQCYHYKPAKERVQEQMEARAHQIILRNILGDPNFSW